MIARLAPFAAMAVLAGSVFAADAPRPKTLAEFGVTFTPPDGWTQQTPENLNEVIAWTQPTQAGQKAAAITLRCEPARGDLDSDATNIALQYGGAVTDEKATIDGEPAKVVWVSRQGVNVEVRALVAQHAGLTYIVECTGPAGGLPRQTLDPFVRSIHWAPLESIADHMAADGPRMAALAGRLSVLRPEIMRPAAPPAMQKEDRFLLLTPRSKGADAEFICVIGLSTSVDARGFGEMATSYLNELNKQDPAAKVVWQQTDGNRRLSNLVSMKKTDMTGGEHQVDTMVGIAQIDGIDHYLVVNFIFNTKDAGARKTYEAAAKKIFDSMKPGEAPK